MPKDKNGDLKIVGLKKIAGDSKYLNPYDCGYIQINYDTAVGEAWGDYHYSLGGNWWTDYHDPDIVNGGTRSRPQTMKELRSLITESVNMLEVP